MNMPRMMGRWARGSGAAFTPRTTRRLLVCLAGLIVVYAVSLHVRSQPTETSRPAAAPEVSEKVDLLALRANPTSPQPPGPFRFSDVARESGIDFVHVSGMTEAKHYPTANGSGVAMFDFDNDGKLDLYFANARRLEPSAAGPTGNRLFKNMGNGRFRDVTAVSGLGFSGFCHGIVVGDLDNDGDQDVFLCNYGPNALFLNNGDGTFRDISRAAGIDRPVADEDRPNWSSSGAFLDYDNDGDLDLYVANYGLWKLPDDDRFCRGSKLPGSDGKDGLRVYCSPKSIRPARHTLYRNNGDRTFTDVTESAGVGRTDGRGLGVVAADINGDGRTDLYVANDLCPNFLYINRGDGTFEDATDISGAGYDRQGQTRAGMGVDAEDVDGDGLTDLFVTNYWGEFNGMFINLGTNSFEDRTQGLNLAFDSLMWVGWGCVLADLDNDGWPDCFVANGHVDTNLEEMGHINPYAQPALLHQNQGGRRFRLATRDAGPYFETDHVGRGVAFGDFDDDGDVDLAVNHKDEAPALLRNDTGTENHWARLSLVGTRSNRDAIGARIEVEAGNRTVVRQRKGGMSVFSAHDPRLLIGLGREAAARRITVRWPSGTVEVFSDVAADRGYLIREGSGKIEPLGPDASKPYPVTLGGAGVSPADHQR